MVHTGLLAAALAQNAPNQQKQDDDTPIGFVFPAEWAVFGPVGKDTPEPDFAGAQTPPAELVLAGQHLKAQKASLHDNRLDLGALLGGKQEGKTEFGEFSLPRVLGCLRHEGLIDGEATLDPTCNRPKGGGSDTLFCGSGYLEPFYFAWEAITRHKDGAAQVNLLLNRSSPWLDMDSYLPYEGKVVLHMRGNTCVKVEFPNREKFTRAEPVYPVFQRDGFRAGRAPTKEVVRHVPPKLVPW